MLLGYPHALSQILIICAISKAVRSSFSEQQVHNLPKLRSRRFQKSRKFSQCSIFPSTCTVQSAALSSRPGIGGFPLLLIINTRDVIDYWKFHPGCVFTLYKQRNAPMLYTRIRKYSITRAPFPIPVPLLSMGKPSIPSSASGMCAWE